MKFLTTKKNQYLDKSVSQFLLFSSNLFVFGCRYYLDFASKNRPLGGLNGIDNSSPDKKLEQFKFLRLYAILHDAAGSLQEKIKTGPGYTHVSPCPKKLLSRSCEMFWISLFFLKHSNQICFIFWVQVMLTQKNKTKNLNFDRSIFLDFEWLKSGKKPLIIKELSVCSAYTVGTVHFLPPVQFNNLSKEEKKGYNWVSKFLHGLR